MSGSEVCACEPVCLRIQNAPLEFHPLLLLCIVHKTHSSAVKTLPGWNSDGGTLLRGQT